MSLQKKSFLYGCRLRVHWKIPRLKMNEENQANTGSEFFGIDTEGKAPDQVELEWFENHYRGDIPQLTLRAVLMGTFLGGVMSLSNLYVGLKTEWGFCWRLWPQSA